MDDDFNASRALSIILNFTKVINTNINNILERNTTTDKLNKENKKINEDVHTKNYKFIHDSLSLLKDFDKIFKIDLFKEKEEIDDNKSSESLEVSLDIREKLRESKNYQLSDEIRNKLVEIGINIED